MITELTNSQVDRLIDYGLKWTETGTSTEAVDMYEAIDAIKSAYELAGLKCPQCFVGPFNNPIDCAKAQVMVKKMDNIDFTTLKTVDIPAGTVFTADELYDAISEQMYGFNDAAWLGCYEFLMNEFDAIEVSKLEGLMDVAETVGWWAPYKEIVFVQNRPEEIHFDEDGELHNENGPAIKWRGNSRDCDIYCIHGVLQAPK